ncbi:hypothetical protein [Burkholderia cenocepacia]|uniref:hypothetical protein n=1 Tax=Burkholderia cenocepacia TaxID=95486 RepID=UPI0015C2FC20|nr:hypothetical protein [Burkholderia cenocepacia]
MMTSDVYWLSAFDTMSSAVDYIVGVASPRETLINEPVVRITDEAGCNFQIDVGI